MTEAILLFWDDGAITFFYEKAKYIHTWSGYCDDVADAIIEFSDGCRVEEWDGNEWGNYSDDDRQKILDHQPGCDAYGFKHGAKLVWFVEDVYADKIKLGKCGKSLKNTVEALMSRLNLEYLRLKK